MSAFSPAVSLVLAVAWGACSIALLRRNSRIELDRVERIPPVLVCLLFAAAAGASYLLPVPYNLSVPVALTGLGTAAWGDWNTQILWDEIVVGSMLLACAAMALGGDGQKSIEGALICGGAAYAIYFAALALSKETGFGDVKMACAIGFALGPAGGALAIFGGSIFWVIATLLWAWSRKIPYSQLRLMPIPFGPGLAAGLILGAAALPLIPALPPL